MQQDWKNTELEDISYLGDVLDALEAVPDTHADKGVLLASAAAIGRRIAALAQEGQANAEDEASANFQALRDARSLGHALAVLDTVPAAKQDDHTLLYGAAALGRAIALLAIDGDDPDPSPEEAAERAALAREVFAKAIESGEVPPPYGPWLGAFDQCFLKVEHGGVLIGARFFGCEALQPIHGEVVRVLKPRDASLRGALILDYDRKFIGVAHPEPTGDETWQRLREAFFAELGEVPARQGGHSEATAAENRPYECSQA